MRRAASVIVLLFAALAIAGRAQDPAAIHGRVMAAASGDSIRGARISLDGGASIPAIVSDDQGRFQFPSAPVGRHTVAATKPGFVRTTVTTTTADEVAIAMARAAVISGTVTDETGEPANGVSVMVGPPPAGDRPPPPMFVATTDDTGQFRVSGIGSGKFLVWVFAAAMNIRMVPGGGLLVSGPG